MFDVVVIGGGLAGAVAALTARAKGASVALASRSWGATALSTGALDIGYSPALSPAAQMSHTIVEHVLDIAAHRPRHPYGVLGIERTIGGVRAGHALVSEALRPGGLELGPLDLESDNLGLPSSLGTVLPAATALSGHLGLDLSRPVAGRWGVVQLMGASSFDARRVAAGLARDAEAQSGQAPDLLVLSIPYDATKPPILLARELDDMSAVDKLAVALAGPAAGLAGVIVPPVVGLDHHAEALARLRAAAGVPVVEALGHVPSVPGLRLQKALDAALARAAVTFVGEVGSPTAARGRVEAVRTTDGVDVRGGAFVLATGRFVAGGITWGERCREALFGLPVVTELGAMEEDSPQDVVRETPMESHPLMTAGVPVGRDLRPLREGRLAFDNLYAAGMIVGGFASRYALCADGVALATGTAAAEGALAALASP